jgi:hypothetical protein
MENDIKILALHPRVLPYYRRFVSGNVGISEDMAARKLTRNVIIADEGGYVKSREAGKAKYQYGNLEILVVGDTIVWIRQHEQTARGWRFNKARHTELSVALGIKAEPAKVVVRTEAADLVKLGVYNGKSAPNSIFQRVRDFFAGKRNQSEQEAM